jgi:hypothetical protein
METRDEVGAGLDRDAHKAWRTGREEDVSHGAHAHINREESDYT